MKTQTLSDTIGITLTSLCLIHCLVLPLIATSLPLFATLSGFEWLHKAFVLIAIPVASTLILSASLPNFARIAASAGLILLIAAAFSEPLHDVETPLTVLGALLLGVAHIYRLTRSKHQHSEQ